MIPCCPACLNCLTRWPLGIQVCAEIYGGTDVVNPKAAGNYPGGYCCTLQRGHPGPHYTCTRKAS